jgi:hypothetical protein
MAEGASDFTHFCLAVWRLTEKAGKQGNKGHADERDTAARHELLHALALRAGVVIAVTFHEVHDTPDCETCAQGDNESLKNTYCAVEKCHIPICRNPAGVLLIMLLSPDCKSRNGLLQRFHGC